MKVVLVVLTRIKKIRKREESKALLRGDKFFSFDLCQFCAKDTISCKKSWHPRIAIKNAFSLKKGDD